ncbi:MAG: metallophosphoesterase [Candidatus Limnocylindrales bacterium]
MAAVFALVGWILLDRDRAETPSMNAAGSVAPSVPGSTAVLVGAGDIADCSLAADSDTATLAASLAGPGGAIFLAGDDAYGDGSAAQFRDCYGPTWGALRERTHPVPGNHDWQTRALSGYLGYFGASAVNADGKPWYAWDLGGWHIVMLDSNCNATGGCDASSPQRRWLATDLASDGATSAACTLAIWHHPRFSSGEHGNDRRTAPFWTALRAAGADLVINGHDHDYERFAAQDAGGAADPEGIVEMVVGTGGANLRHFEGARPNSVARSSTRHGVLRLTLAPMGYAWEFVAVGGEVFDAGSGTCH